LAGGLPVKETPLTRPGSRALRNASGTGVQLARLYRAANENDALSSTPFVFLALSSRKLETDKPRLFLPPGLPSRDELMSWAPLRAVRQPRRAYFSTWGRVKSFVLGRTEVGKDEHAVYYVQQSGTGPRRVFEMHKADADFTDVSPEWLAWLRGTRAEPPTAEESTRLSEQRAFLQRNAAERSRAEALRRDRARVLKSDAREGPADALGGEPHSWTPKS